ncbi:MAG: response regulator, partial [Actinomycetota bacterium]
NIDTPRVLVAEDDPAVRSAVVRVLELEGYRVTAVNDGAAALAAITSSPPDAVVMDVMMPFADGLTVCREARLRGSRVPILLLTAKHEVNDRVAVSLEFKHAHDRRAHGRVVFGDEHPRCIDVARGSRVARGGHETNRTDVAVPIRVRTADSS